MRLTSKIDLVLEMSIEDLRKGAIIEDGLICAREKIGLLDSEVVKLRDKLDEVIGKSLYWE